jgi:hypothetical protein
MFVVVLWSSNVDAQIFKCVVNGKTIYQSEPCKINIQEKSQSSAFDGWIFGETINHVKRIARNRQLPRANAFKTTQIQKDRAVYRANA